MAEEYQDELAQRVARRRAEEANRKTKELEPTITEPGLVVPENKETNITQPQVVQEKKQTTDKSKPAAEINITLTPELEEIAAAILAGENPMKIARQLSDVLAAGMQSKELLAKLDKSPAWLSKRIRLLKAPKDIQRLIEAGELSEAEYYNNRENIKAGVHGRGETIKYQRMPNVTIGMDTAIALAEILKILAEQKSAATIRIEKDKNGKYITSKKDLTNILSMRASDILGRLK
jgi:Xaa-Pro aminopeptidase